MAQASRDQNNVPTLLGVSSSDGATPVPIYANPTTHRLLVDSTGGGSGITSINTDTTAAQIIAAGTGISVTDNGTGTHTIANLYPVLYASQQAGADIGAQINAAYAALPSTGGAIVIPEGTSSYSTPIVLGTNGKFASLIGTSAASTFLKYTPTSGNGITINCGNPTGHLVYEVTGFTLMGSSTLIAAGNTNTNTSVGIFYGGANGAVGINTHDMNVNGFGTNWQIGSNAYMLSFNNNANSGGNGGQSTQGSLLHMNMSSNSGERNVFSSNAFTDPGNSSAVNAIRITGTGTASNFFTDNSFDDAQIYVGTSDGQTVINGNHFENPAFGTYGQYTAVQGVSSDLSTQISFCFNEIANDGTNSGNTFITIIQHGGQLTAIGNHIDNYGGATITNFIDHSLDNGLASELVGMTQVSQGGLTNLIAGSGGVPWTQANGACFIQNISNSYTIGLRANGSNTNEFFSGTNTVGSFDHNGNWVFLAQAKTPLILTPNNAITATSNAATVPVTSRLSTVTNNSAATLTITLTASGAVDGQLLMVRILDSSAATQTITWTNTENSTVSVPTTSNGSTTLFLTVGFIYNNATSKWRCIASA